MDSQYEVLGPHRIFSDFTLAFNNLKAWYQELAEIRVKFIDHEKTDNPQWEDFYTEELNPQFSRLAEEYNGVINNRYYNLLAQGPPNVVLENLNQPQQIVQIQTLTKAGVIGDGFELLQNLPRQNRHGLANFFEESFDFSQSLTLFQKQLLNDFFTKDKTVVYNQQEFDLKHYSVELVDTEIVEKTGDELRVAFWLRVVLEKGEYQQKQTGCLKAMEFLFAGLEGKSYVESGISNINDFTLRIKNLYEEFYKTLLKIDSEEGDENRDRDNEPGLLKEARDAFSNLN